MQYALVYPALQISVELLKMHITAQSTTVTVSTSISYLKYICILHTVCFVRFSQWTVIVILISCHRFFFTMETDYIFLEVESELPRFIYS